MEVVIVSDGQRPDVSGPIRSVNMYSYVQCTMQERSVCCRDVCCLAHIEQAPGPLHPEHLPPPPYLPGYWGLSLLAAFNKDGPGQWSGHLQAAQPRTCGLGKCMFDIVLYLRPVILSFGMLIK